MIIIPRARFSRADLWHPPAQCSPFDLIAATDGSSPRLPTRCYAWRDDARFYTLFLGRDAGTRATYHRHDDPLWEEDVVEIFLAPATPARYFEIEVSPLGTLFDAEVHSPDGLRSTMSVNTRWNCDGLWAAVRRVVRPPEEQSWDTLVSIPFASLGQSAPPAGARWRANFYRIDRGEVDEFTAWQPTGKTPPDFHVPHAFGEIVFV